MTIKDNCANIILIGCGPHATRSYLPAITKIQEINLLLVVDLKEQEETVRSKFANQPHIEFLFIDAFEGDLPDNLFNTLSTYSEKNNVRGVIIATEPLVHKSYALWALANHLNILLDKPITTRKDVVSNLDSAVGILEDFHCLFQSYKKSQRSKETIFMINAHRRYHKGFQFVRNKIAEIAELTNCPVSFIHAYHCDGQWRLPNEIITQKYHPYSVGYGKGSHSGYHIFDTVYQLYSAADLPEKLGDNMEISSSFVKPNGFFTQYNSDDYAKIFGDSYKSVSKLEDDELKNICKEFGEIDISSIITLKQNAETIANISINLLHNGFSGRTWLTPGEDLYKGNGRIKHESYIIQQGPFQSIQIHAYQGDDKHDLSNGYEEYLGGKNHFDIHVYRNPMFANSKIQPEIFKMTDLIADSAEKTSSKIEMESTKFQVVGEFAKYLNGTIKKHEVLSQLEDHIIPVQIMSGIYQSNIFRSKENAPMLKMKMGI